MLREADGSVKLVVVRPHADGKVFAPGCASKNRTVRAGEEPEEHKRHGNKDWDGSHHLKITETLTESTASQWN